MGDAEESLLDQDGARKRRACPRSLRAALPNRSGQKPSLQVERSESLCTPQPHQIGACAAHLVPQAGKAVRGTWLTGQWLGCRVIGAWGGVGIASTVRETERDPPRLISNPVSATIPLVATTSRGLVLLRPICEWSLTPYVIAHHRLLEQHPRPHAPGWARDTTESNSYVDGRDSCETTLKEVSHQLIVSREG